MRSDFIDEGGGTIENLKSYSLIFGQREERESIEDLIENFSRKFFIPSLFIKIERDMLKFQYDDLTDRWRMHRREWLFIFFPFSCTIDIYMYNSLGRKSRRQKKKKKRCIERRVEYDKGMENLGHGKRQNIVFPFFSGTTMARQGGDGVFRKNTSAPAHGCRCCIFFPRVPLFFIAFFSLLGRRAGCEISKRKHWSEVKSSQLLNFLLLLLFFFSFDRNRIQSKGRIIQKISSNSIIPTTEEEIVGSSIDRLIKNDILQEKRKKFDCCIVSIGDRWNNLIQAKSIIDDIHSTLCFCSDFSCNEWQSGGKIKNQKLKFWKEKGGWRTRRWLVSENFIDSFIHGERKGKATVTCCTNRATRMLLLLSRKRVAFRPALHWLKAHPFRWHFPQISLRSKRDPIETKQYRIMSLLSTRFLYNQIDCFQFNRDGYILLSFSFLFIHRIKYNLQMYIISYRFCEM